MYIGEKGLLKLAHTLFEIQSVSDETDTPLATPAQQPAVEKSKTLEVKFVGGTAAASSQMKALFRYSESCWQWLSEYSRAV